MILTTRGPNDGMDHYALWLAFFNLMYPYGYFDPKMIVIGFFNIHLNLPTLCLTFFSYDDGEILQGLNIYVANFICKVSFLIAQE